MTKSKRKFAITDKFLPSLCYTWKIQYDRSTNLGLVNLDSLKTCAPEKAVVGLTPGTVWSTRSSLTFNTYPRSPVFHLPQQSTMARGDEIKTASKATYACKQFDVSAPMKKPIASQSVGQSLKKPEQKNYGAWGSTFKDKKTFVDMHHC